jgi:RsiW-degrading membrane proteinase PrsW (M82 family)
MFSFLLALAHGTASAAGFATMESILILATIARRTSSRRVSCATIKPVPSIHQLPFVLTVICA